MLRHRRRDIALAVGSSALAGYVDAIGFLSLGGFFVSFMSGNSTRLAVGIAGVPAEALIAGRLIASFLVGVILGSLVGRAAGQKRRPVVLALVAALLAAGAGTAGLNAPDIAVLFVAAAMGAENTTFERDGEVSIGLTYMTGTLVKLGQRLAATLTGGPAWAWLPYALLWLGLVTGAVIGALAFPVIGLAGLWFAAAIALALSGMAFLLARAEAG
ncbi:MAG: YoaK family protein [Hyphomonadaceae bacterium]